MTNKKITLGKNYYKELLKLLKNSVCDLSGVACAAIIVTDKGIFKGVNYEDVITNLGMCAERNAIFNGVTNGMKEIYEIHVMSSYKDIEMCGACRQVACSFTKPTRKVYRYSVGNSKPRICTLGQLMPMATKPTNK